MNNTVLKISKEVIFDTVIIGGGLAGCGAAIASARNGDKTLLVEASGVLGGQATLGLVTPLDARFTKSGKSFGGIMEEISEKTIKLTKEYCSCGVDGKISHIASPHILKYVLVDIVEESGADIYFHTTILSANTDGDNITSVILSGKSGRRRWQDTQACRGTAPVIEPGRGHCGNPGCGHPAPHSAWDPDFPALPRQCCLPA